MKQADQIPIKNIYHMLVYAWQKTWARDIVSLSELKLCSTIEQLLSKILLNCVNSILKRGCDRGYVNIRENLQSPKGQLNFARSINCLAQKQLKLNCSYQDFSLDILQNQIIKATLKKMLVCSSFKLDQEVSSGLEIAYMKLRDVSSIVVIDDMFNQIQLHSNNSAYGLALDVCRLINRCLLVSEETGTTRFVDFSKNSRQMPGLFEEFLRNFYKLRQTQYRVRSQKLYFNTEPSKVLPSMQTDITLESQDTLLVIDAKFYKSIFQYNQFANKTIRNDHIYQLHAYLTAAQQITTKTIEGMIIYAESEEAIQASVDVLGFNHHYNSINLNQDWQIIEKDLLYFLDKGV